MTQAVLPSPESNPGKAEWPEVYANDKALLDTINGGLDNGNLSGSAGITPDNLASTAKPLRWHTPKIVEAEQVRESSEYGTLATADEIQGVELNENGLILVLFQALVKSSVKEAGRVAIFLGSSQLKDHNGDDQFAQTGADPEGKEGFRMVRSSSVGLGFGGKVSPTGVTTGQLVADGFSEIRAAAGSYNVAIKYRATSGSVTASFRKLWVGVLG